MQTEETRAGRQLVRLGFVLAAIAALTAEYSLDRPAVPGAFRVLQTLLLTAWAAGIHVFLTRRRQGEAIPSVGTMLATSLMLAGLWAADLGVTLSGMPGISYELLMVLLMRDAALSAIALSGNPVCLRLSGGLTLAVMLFSSVLAEHRILYVLATIYALLGSYWLILLYWSFIQVKLLEGKDHRPPILAIAVWGLLVGAMTVLVVGPRRTIGVLGELMPTSGGTTIADASAQSGVGDGPNLAQGINNPTTSGPVDTDLFLETKDTSLYDAATDRYGEPEKPNNRRSLAVAIQNLDGRELQDEQSRQSNPTREFSVVRSGPRRDRSRPDMIGGEAYSVKGKLPLHFRFLAFDEFDGRAWREPSTGIDSIDLSLGFAGWIELPRRARDFDAGTVRHEVVVGEIEAPQVPLPTRADRFRIDRIERPDFFAEGQEGILRYRADALPKQTKLETSTPTLDPARLRALSIPPGRTYALPKYLRALSSEPPEEDGPPPEARELDPRIVALAQEWTDGVDRGWPQVEAVVDRLRADFERDDSATIDPDIDDPIAHFLLEQRRGDDYAFASAACLLLRSLGYPTRFVQGLYVNPERFDPDSGWTPVFWPGDLHTWAEVQLPTREWVVIEPTPGFDVLGPEPSLLARVGGAIVAVGRWMARHPAIAVGALLVAVALVGLWKGLARVLAMLAWWLTFRGGSRRRVVVTVQLLERRAALSGSRRPGSVTLRDWYDHAADELDDDPAREAIRRLVRLSEWAFYAPKDRGTPGDEDADSIREHCRQVSRLCARGSLWSRSPGAKESRAVRRSSRRISMTAAGLVLVSVASLALPVRADDEPLPDLPPFPEIFAGMGDEWPDDEPNWTRGEMSESSMRALGIEPLDDLSAGDQRSLATLQGITACWFFLVGAAFGSFLNVVVYRMPRGLPLWGRKSHCPSCQTPLTFRENIPIVGWLRVRGRCRSCSAPISPRYPIVELITGLIFLALLHVELLSGGRTVPVRTPNTYAGVVWILWYPKWDLIGLYASHLFLLCVLLSIALIASDRQPIPKRLLALAIAVGYLGPMLDASLHPVPLRFPRPVWLPGSGFSAAELLNGGVGHVSGMLVGLILSRGTRRNSGLISTLGLAGLFLGWQAALSAGLIAAGLILVASAASRVLSAARALPPVGWAASATLIQILAWRSVSDLPNWPSHAASPVALALAVGVIAGLAGLSRLLDSGPVDVSSDPEPIEDDSPAIRPDDTPVEADTP